MDLAPSVVTFGSCSASGLLTTGPVPPMDTSWYCVDAVLPVSGFSAVNVTLLLIRAESEDGGGGVPEIDRLEGSKLAHGGNPVAL